MNPVLEIVIIAAVVFVILLLIFGRLFRQSKDPVSTSEPEQQGVATDSEVEFFENYPRCVVCSAVATEPMPQVVRKRTGWFRLLGSLFSFPILYRRRVDSSSALKLCKSDAHLADAEVDLFLANDVRGEQAKLNISIARKVAQFETTLPERIRTEKERQGGTTTTPPSIGSLRPLRAAGSE